MNSLASNVLALCVVIGVAGCAYPTSPQSHTDRATLAACRDYASQLYDRRNRGEIYSINQVGVPYSGSYLPGYQTVQLAEKYDNSQVVDDCIRNTGTGISREDAAAPPASQP